MNHSDLKSWIDAFTSARRFDLSSPFFAAFLFSVFSVHCSLSAVAYPRRYTGHSMPRRFIIQLLALLLAGLSGCGYHTLGAATHLPPDVKTLAVPVFSTQTDNSGAETAMTEAVIREFAARTRFRVISKDSADADAVLQGTILKQSAMPLTYNAATQQSSSFLITIVASVTLNARDGKVLYRNNNYVFREQYQSSTNLPTFLQEDPAAIERLSRDFARQLVADVLEGF